MEVERWNGTISRSDFSSGARTFAEKWRKISSPPWSWNSPPARHPLKAEGYLSLEKVCRVVAKPIAIIREEDDVSAAQQLDDGFDYATLVHSNDPYAHYYDFHVIYSDTFRIPVLYFRGYSNGIVQFLSLVRLDILILRGYVEDGQSLSLNQIEEDLPRSSTQVLLESKWTFITQEEHPYLNRPWFKLHPCGTAEWMTLFFPGLQSERVPVERYLVSWFSVVGQVIGLRVPLEMAIEANSYEDKPQAD